MQIIVLGSKRSGASLATRLINMMGAHFNVGHSSVGFLDEHPKGFWERGDVVACNEDILRHFECNAEQLSGWKMIASPSKKTLTELEPVTSRMKKILSELDASRPWVMKDPRLCLTLPFWRPLLEAPVFVMVSRDPVEVARSLVTRDGWSLAQGLALWEYYACGAINALKGAPVIHVSHTEILSEPEKLVKRLFGELEKHGVSGLHLPTNKEITSFIDSSLYRSKLEKTDRARILTAYQEMLAGYLSGKEKAPDEVLQPSLLAENTMLCILAQQSRDEKLARANELISDVDQQRNELSSELQLLRSRSRDEIERLERLLAERETDVTLIQNSLGWRICNAFVHLFRTLTFRST